ncbi:hypothetical protein YC2023_097877 [Brassica napus]
MDFNYDWLDPLSGYVGNPSPGPAIIIKHLFLILFESSSRSFKRRLFSRHLTDESSFDRRVLTRPFCRHFDRRVLTRPTSPHSTDESSLDRRVLTRPFCRHFDRRVVVSIRFKLGMRPSLNPTDESSSHLFTSLLTVLGSNSCHGGYTRLKSLNGYKNENLKRADRLPVKAGSVQTKAIDRIDGQ